MPNEFTHDVFLSHSVKDKAVVRPFDSLSASVGERARVRCRRLPLAERLRANGLKVWFNEWVLKPSDSLPMQAYKIMHDLWGMGPMMFTKFIVVVDDDMEVHNTSEVLFRLCANTDPQRDSVFSKGHERNRQPQQTRHCATKKLPGEGFKRAWPPLIKMEESVKSKVEKLSKS